MDANKYQRLALRTWAGGDAWLDDAMYAGAKLSVEANEVLQLIAKFAKHGKEYDADDVREELGDVLWYVALVAELHDMTLDGIMHANIAKLIQRHPSGDTRAFYQRD